MTARYTTFLTELAALMKKHDVVLCAREGGGDYQTWADGVNVEFNSLPYDDNGNRAPDGDYCVVELGAGTYEIDAESVAASACSFDYVEG